MRSVHTKSVDFLEICKMVCGATGFPGLYCLYGKNCGFEISIHSITHIALMLEAALCEADMGRSSFKDGP